MAHPSFSNINKVLVYERAQGHCQYCDKSLSAYWAESCFFGKLVTTFIIEGAHIHHKLPIYMGGVHRIWNWVLLCIFCHRKLHANLMREDVLKELRQYLIDTEGEGYAKLIDYKP